MGNPFNDALTRACERNGIPRITPHGLRHTGNDVLRRFASREVVMSITGHSTPAMHSHYSHVDAGEKARVKPRLAAASSSLLVGDARVRDMIERPR